MMVDLYSETIEVSNEESINDLEGKKQVTFSVHIIILIYLCTGWQRPHDHRSASIYPTHTIFYHSQEGSRCNNVNLSR